MQIEIGMRIKPAEASQPTPSETYDFYVATDGDDGAAGTTEAPFSSLTRLASAMKVAASGTTQTALVRTGAYTDDQFNPFTAGRSGVRIELTFEKGCTLAGGIKTERGYNSGINASNGGIIVVQGNGLIISGYASGSGNGISASGDGEIYVYDCTVEDCVDGFSLHNTAYGEIHRCTLRRCTKDAVVHVDATVSKQCDCTIIGHESVGQSGPVISFNSAGRHEMHRCVFIPQFSNDKLVLRDVSSGRYNVYLKDCVLGTLTTAFVLSVEHERPGLVVEDSFVHVQSDAHEPHVMRRCWGYYSIRHRDGGKGPVVLDSCIFGGPSAIAGKSSAFYASYNPGAGSPVMFIDTVLTGYATAIGDMGPVASRQAIDAGFSMSHCLLYANIIDFDADFAAADGFAAAVNNNFIGDPLLGSMNKTDKSAWGYQPGSTCIGAGSDGGNIGFSA